MLYSRDSYETGTTRYTHDEQKGTNMTIGYEKEARRKLQQMGGLISVDEVLFEALEAYAVAEAEHQEASEAFLRMLSQKGPENPELTPLMDRLEKAAEEKKVVGVMLAEAVWESI